MFQYAMHAALNEVEGHTCCLSACTTRYISFLIRNPATKLLLLVPDPFEPDYIGTNVLLTWNKNYLKALSLWRKARLSAEEALERMFIGNRKTQCDSDDMI